MSSSTANTREVFIVREPFNNYKRGDKITDPQLIQDILNSAHAGYVNRILLPAIQSEITPEITLEIKSVQPLLKASKKSKE